VLIVAILNYGIIFGAKVIIKYYHLVTEQVKFYYIIIIFYLIFIVSNIIIITLYYLGIDIVLKWFIIYSKFMIKDHIISFYHLPLINLLYNIFTIAKIDQIKYNYSEKLILELESESNNKK
jgi:hypothetical protein